MYKKTLRSILGCVGFCALLYASVAHADVVIDVAWHGAHDPTFDERHMAPGESVEHEVSIKNKGEVQDLYLKLDDIDGRTFADQLHFYLIDKSSGKYLVGGRGDRFTVQELVDDGSVFVERLEAGARNRYVIKVSFDKDAGNAVQGMTTRFDMTFGFKGEPTTSDAPLPLRAGQFAGGNPAPEVLGVETETNFDDETLTKNSEEGNVLGVAAELCVPWLPWYYWLLVLVVLALTAMMTVRVARRTDNQSHMPLISLILFGLLTLVSIVLWYILEHCHTLWWFSLAAVILFAITFFTIRAQNTSDKN